MKKVGYLIKEPGRDPLYPRYDFDTQDIGPGDVAAGYTSEPVYTLTDEDREILTHRFNLLFGVFLLSSITGVIAAIIVGKLLS